MSLIEFSSKTRAQSLERMKREEFDLLVVGGGITGAAVARDAASRGLSVALIEKDDFAHGTSSKSSKLVHGGLRYLEKMEFRLVFEALHERTLLLRTMPHLVRPLPFYFPVFKGDSHGMWILSIGLWLYDLLSSFRAPGFHKRLSRLKFSEAFPKLKSDGLKGGFRYYDASMWDDRMVVEVLRSAQVLGATSANYVEALRPLWKNDRVSGFKVRDVETGQDFDVRSKRVVLCGGPWTDELGLRVSKDWQSWLKPSKGVHLIFDLKRIPIPGALVMSEDKNGRISFVIPRPDMGAGVVIVGTTDGPAPKHPDQAKVEKEDIAYLLALLARYFPDLNLTEKDILSTYVGVRPLFELQGPKGSANAASLQKVSREHHIGTGPGGVVVVAGGKYTTHRVMGQEIVDAVIKGWKKDASLGRVSAVPALLKPKTTEPVNPRAVVEATESSRNEASTRGIQVPEKLWDLYGGEALEVKELDSGTLGETEGFPCLEGQVRFAARTGMALHLKDVYLRRLPLFSARADHGLPLAEKLAEFLSEELEKPAAWAQAEVKKLKEALAQL